MTYREQLASGTIVEYYETKKGWVWVVMIWNKNKYVPIHTGESLSKDKALEDAKRMYRSIA